MKKLRWVMDGEFWDVDISTPRTIDGAARPVASKTLLPLGLSRGTTLSRPKQIDFMQRFMAAPFVPSYCGDPAHGGRGLSLQRVLTLPFGHDWFATLLGLFNLQKFVSSVRKDRSVNLSEALQSIRRHLRDKSFYALGLCSELLVTPDDVLLFACEVYGDTKMTQKKAVYHHKFSHHNLMMEAVSPGLCVDKDGSYWDVPLSMTMDLASIPSDSGASYHFLMQHTSGTSKQSEGNQTSVVPTTLLPGLCIKGGFSFKKNVDIWRSNANKLKLVQPYDIFLSNPHISASGIIGVVATASVGENSGKVEADDEPQSYRHFKIHACRGKSAFLADLHGTLSFTAQHGNFQRPYLDLTRIHTRFDFSSGSKFLSAALCLAQDYQSSKKPNLEALQAICPTATLSLQQQVVGPFSLRVDSDLAINLKNKEWQINLDKPVFAIEYALQVLGSAKAIAWYAPKQKEFMVELRFFEI